MTGSPKVPFVATICVCECRLKLCIHFENSVQLLVVGAAVATLIARVVEGVFFWWYFHTVTNPTTNRSLLASYIKRLMDDH